MVHVQNVNVYFGSERSPYKSSGPDVPEEIYAGYREDYPGKQNSHYILSARIMLKDVLRSWDQAVSL